MRTLPEALKLLEDLLTAPPPPLVCVIDGIQLAEDGEPNDDGTGIFLDYLIVILRRAMEEKVLKVLLTTDGFSRRTLNAEEQVDLMTKTGRGSSQGGKGRMSLEGVFYWK